MTNYFNKLSPEEKLIQLGKCRFMDSSEFYNGVSFLKDKKNSNCWLWFSRIASRIKYA